MEQTNHSTDTLLASFQAGNMAAFSQLYNLHINVLFNYGLKLTIDKELLKDCIHDIFVKLYTKKDELGTIDNLKSYLFISLKNKLCDELRKRMYMSDTAIEDVNAVAPTDVEDATQKWVLAGEAFTGPAFSPAAWSTYIILYRRKEIRGYLWDYEYELSVCTQPDAPWIDKIA